MNGVGDIEPLDALLRELNELRRQERENKKIKRGRFERLRDLVRYWCRRVGAP